MPKQLTPEIINAAIVGFEQQQLHIDTQIAELRAMLSGSATGQHGPEVGNLCVDVELLLFKTDDGGVDDLGSELFWHVRCSFLDSLGPALLILLVLYYTCPVIDPRADHLNCVSAMTV